MRKIIIMYILLAMSLSCQDKTTAPSPQSDYFPNNIGDVWLYSVYDSLSMSSYEMTVSVVDTTTLWDMPVSIWVFDDIGDTDTMFVSVEDDTVTFYATRSQEFAKKYIFPLASGKTWNCGDYCMWDYSVDAEGPVEVPAGPFANAYDIEGQYSGFNTYGLLSEWYVPHIGLARIYRFSVCTVCSPMIDTNETWELISFNLRTD